MDEFIITHLQAEIANIRKTLLNISKHKALDNLLKDIVLLEKDIRVLIDKQNSIQCDVDNRFPITIVDLNENFLELCADDLCYNNVSELLDAVDDTMILGHITFPLD